MSPPADRLGTKSWNVVSICATLGLCLCWVTSDYRGLAAEPSPSPAETAQYAIALHGGAGSSPDSFTDQQNQSRRDSLHNALKKGRDALAGGGTALDAVEAVIRLLEDDPLFNAGKGAVFNADGKHELDASIMDGCDKSCGAVAGVTTVKNPISLARLVMTDTRHILLAGGGADRFAREMGIDLVDQDYFYTEAKYEAWQRGRQKEGNQSRTDATPQGTGTVGCVALDSHGNLAAGTSTGGLTNKRLGRVGDTPIIGAGNYADNETCAVSGTGIGEHFIRHAVAYEVAALMKYKGLTVNEAVQEVVHHTLQPGHGGVIAVSHDGQIAIDFNTRGMACAAADSRGRFEVMWGNARHRPTSETDDTPPLGNERNE